MVGVKERGHDSPPFLLYKVRFIVYNSGVIETITNNYMNKENVGNACQTFYNIICFGPFVAMGAVIGLKTLTVELGWTQLANYLTSIGI